MDISSSGGLTGIFESEALGIIKSVGGASIVHRVGEGVVWGGRVHSGGSVGVYRAARHEAIRALSPTQYVITQKCCSLGYWGLCCVSINNNLLCSFSLQFWYQFLLAL